MADIDAPKTLGSPRECQIPKLSILAPWRTSRASTPSNESIVSSSSPRSPRSMTLGIPFSCRAFSTFPRSTTLPSILRNRERRPSLPSPQASQYDQQKSEHHRRSAIMLQRPNTFPTARTPDSDLQGLSIDPTSLKRHYNPNLCDTQLTAGKSRRGINPGDSRWSVESFARPFSAGPLLTESKHSIRPSDFQCMIELHMLDFRKDYFVRFLQRHQCAEAELHAMKIMLEDRTASSNDDVFIARTGNSSDPKDIIGWLSCSIIHNRASPRKKSSHEDLRALDINLAIAVVLNRQHNCGIKTLQPGDLRQRNHQIEALARGCKLSQIQEFPDEDFIAITNLVIHPFYPTRRDVAIKLIHEALTQASKLGMPIYVFAAGKFAISLYEDEDLHFREIGEHRCLQFEPVYTWKHFVSRRGTEWKPRTPPSSTLSKSGSADVG